MLIDTGSGSTVFKVDKVEDFSNGEDIYIVDKSISWTYVHTHEEYCGPYFYKITRK